MTQFKVMQPPVAIQAGRPLCVDLDGTLVKSDTLVDSLMVLARRHPTAFLRTPLWALKGKAYLKSQVASLVTLDAAHLPYNRPLLDYLREEHAAGRKINVSANFADRVRLPVALAKALRIHQWAKNLLVFLPLLLAHSLHLRPVLAATAAFFCFCFTASATYIFNDLLDLEHDRVHLNKRKRAFAAGDLSVATGLGISFSLAALAAITALYLPPKFQLYLLLYFVTTLA